MKGRTNIDVDMLSQRLAQGHSDILSSSDALGYTDRHAAM